jgi:hypothetical protein
MFIESPATETEEQFRAYLTELLTSIYGRMPEWLEFQVGSRVERQGTLFRQFICVAGSVHCQIQVRAGRPGGIGRAMILRGSTVRGLPHCSESRDGVETEFDCHEIHAA